MAQQLSQGLQGGAARRPPRRLRPPAGVKPDEVMATLEKLAELKAKGILTEEEFDGQEGRAAEEAGLGATPLRRLGHRRQPAARLPRRVPELRRAGRVPLGGVGVRGLQLLPQHASCATARRCAASARAPSCSTTTRRCSSAPPARYQGAAFTLVGRLQYRYADGTWNEWHALFDNGRSGWLSEDNGRYVIAFDAPLDGAAPARRDAARRAVAAWSAGRPGRSPRSRAAQADRGAGRAARHAAAWSAASSSPTCATRAARWPRSTTATRPRRRGRSAARWRSASWR